MVDFNNENTVSTPATDIVRVLILERRYNLMEVIEAVHKEEALGIDTASQTAVVKARLLSFYYEIAEALPRQMTEEEITLLEKQLRSEKFEELLKAFRILNRVLDKLKLTRIDTKSVYDPTNVEEENKKKNL